MRNPTLLVLIAVLIAGSGCGAHTRSSDRPLAPGPAEPCPEPPYPECRCACETSFSDPVQEAYRVAVCDAATAEAGEVVDSLVPLVPDEPGLRWKEIDGVPRVLVVTWAGKAWAEKLIGHEGQPTDVRARWVTPAPSLQRLCQTSGLHGAALDMRLRQALGLWPGATYTHFVELWMAPDQLFRPCPDSDVTDRRCELEYPNGTPEDHRRWFDGQRGRGRWYGCEKQQLYATPFTGLGYTYDWSKAGTEVGLSEYVAKGRPVDDGPKSPVAINLGIVHRVLETEAYCNPSTPSP